MRIEDPHSQEASLSVGFPGVVLLFGVRCRIPKKHLLLSQIVVRAVQ